MNMNNIITVKKEAENHLINELLLFWTTRIKDETNDGFIKHFDKDAKDTGEDEKSLIAQTRYLYTISSAHRAGYGDRKYTELAKHGIDFLIDKRWDKEYSGFFCMMDRKGNVKIDQKIIYGHSFAMF
jgi:mannose 2-epimerase